jgi:hypothetical protein
MEHHSLKGLPPALINMILSGEVDCYGIRDYERYDVTTEDNGRNRHDRRKTAKLTRHKVKPNVYIREAISQKTASHKEDS